MTDGNQRVARGNAQDDTTISVLVPTYRRPDDLRRCLTALTEQTRRADAVVLVAREDDDASWTVISEFESQLPVRRVAVSQPGQVHALNAGLDAIDTAFVAITDDDAAPWPEWLARIVAHFVADARVGGVGGRDHMYVGGQLVDGREPVVGRVLRFRKHIGNHHLGFGVARSVDVLKGANMSYRMSAVGTRRFDVRLRGTGAQVHNDLAFSLALRRAGWKLIYDPAVAVDHFPAVRFDEDKRDAFNAVAMTNSVYNETLVRLELMPAWERPGYLAWAVLAGTRAAPGLLQCLRFLPGQRGLAARKMAAALRGRADATRDALIKN